MVYLLLAVLGGCGGSSHGVADGARAAADGGPSTDSTLVVSDAPPPRPDATDPPPPIDAGPGPELDAAEPEDGAPPPFDADVARDARPPTDARPPMRDARTRIDGAILPPVDAGDPFGDAGLAPPPWVPIEVLTMGMCDPLVPCGGDVVGSWEVTGACVEIPVPMELMRCPGARIAQASGRARGRVSFDGMVVDRVAQSEVVVEIFIPALCAAFVGGCGAIEGLVQMSIPDSACITEDTGACSCAVRRSDETIGRDAYTLMGNTIVGTLSGRRYDYCVDGTDLRYRDVSPGTMQEPGIVDLSM